VNCHRILHHDYILLPDLRSLLVNRNMDRYGNKEDLIERFVGSDIRPSGVLSALDRQKLSDMCRYVRLKSSGNDLISRLLGLYDDLTFEERTTRDEREEWFNNYELLARVRALRSRNNHFLSPTSTRPGRTATLAW
jgi:hypothetical protein